MVTHPYQAFLHRLLKPARYVGAEYGVIHKPWEGVRTRFCLAFPDTYELGMSHLGLKVLYEGLGAEPDLMCERAFAPWLDLESELRERDLPLVSLESARPLRDFDVVGFSLQFELTYTTVLAMLELGGIPLRAADRTEQDPLVLGGGPVASHPEPVAPFFDLILLGDAERTLPELLRADADLRDRGVDRTTRVRELAGRPEIYAPALESTATDPDTGRLVVGDPATPAVTRHWEPDLAPLVDTGGGPVPSIEAVFDRAAIEVARGCNQGCRFCQAGFLYRPLRERPLDGVLEALETRSKSAGYDEVSLTALSTADYSALGPLLRRAASRLGPRNVSMSVSSLRAIGLDGQVLDDLRTGRAGSLTFAPEAGSQRMRDRINKRISEEGLLDTARAVAARGWNHLKLYFMIGLPGEQDEDVTAILELAERVRKAAASAAPRRAPRVTCAVNNFVPKPHTPMQWCAMEGEQELRRRQALLRRHGLSRRLGLRLHNLPMSLLEAQLARGDRRLADVVERAYRAGARYDGWEDQFRPAYWDKAFTDAQVDPAPYLASLPVGGRLPWDHVAIGVEPGFFAKEHDKLTRDRVGPACGVPGEATHQTDLACLRCGLPCLEAPPRRAAEEAPPDDGMPALPAPPAPPPFARRLRVVFSKRSPASTLSHLDLVRHVPRILRRAGLHPAYTQGFNPRPRLQFTPPLPVGAEADADACDLWVVVDPEDTPDADACLERLRAASLPGLEFSSARWTEDGETALSKLCQGARYRFVLLSPPAEDAVRERIAELLARDIWEVERKGKKKKRHIPRTLDVRASLATLDLEEQGGQWSLSFTLAQQPGGTIRPREVIDAALGETEPPGRLVRLHHLRRENGQDVILTG